MKNLAVSVTRTIGIMILMCAFSGLINNPIPMLYALVIGTVYMLSCSVASIKISMLEKMQEAKRDAIYLIAYFVMDVAVTILSLKFIAPGYGYANALMVAFVWFMGKLLFYSKLRYDMEVKK